MLAMQSDGTTTTLMEPSTQARGTGAVTRGLWTELLTVALFCAFLFYFGLGSFGLVGADEPRYAQIAREMLARHDWITPVLNGVPWLEKPVLYYWGAMLSYRVFGVSDWAARLPSAALASVMVFGIYFFMRRFRPGNQLNAALIAASSAAVLGFARAASTDMPLAAMFTLGMLAWYGWLETKRRAWLAGFYFFMGLGALAKGPVAPFLAALIIVVFALLRREPRLMLRTLWWPGVLLFLAIAMPWYAAVQARNPGFFRSFFFVHNVERFSKDVFHHPQPFWYYVPVLLLCLAPWAVYVVVSIVKAPAQATTGRRAGTPPRLFLIVWLIAPVVFFSASQSKLPGYILPVIPAGALLLADYLGRTAADRAKPNFVLVVLHSALGALLLGGVLLTQYFVLRVPPPREANLVGGVVAALIFAGMALTLRWRGLRLLRFVTLVPVILGLAFLIRAGSPALDNALSERPVARELERINAGGMPVAVFNAKREIEYGLNFYRNQPIPRYERGEVPAEQHLVIAPMGSRAELETAAAGRRISWVGEFAPQRLEFFWVSAPGVPGHQHAH